MKFYYCDVTKDDEVKELFSKIENLDGVLHSIAYANPKPVLEEKFYIQNQRKIFYKDFI